MEIVLLVAVVAFAGWFFFLRTKKVENKEPVAPYKVETPQPTPAPEPEVVSKPADDRVEVTAPVAEPVAEQPKKKVAKIKAPKAATGEKKPAKAKTKTDAKAPGLKRTK